MKKYAYDAGEMILGPRYVERWFRTDNLHLLVVGISDAALTAAARQICAMGRSWWMREWVS
jgi:hypothetical protein